MIVSKVVWPDFSKGYSIAGGIPVFISKTADFTCLTLGVLRASVSLSER